MVTVSEKVKIGEIVEVFQGINTSGRGAGARAGSWRVRAVSAGDIHDDRVNWKTLPMMNIEDSVRTRFHKLLPNDVLLTSRSTAVKAALVHENLEDAVAEGSLLVLRETSTTKWAVAKYIWTYLTSDFGRDEVAALMTGVTIKYLGPKSIAELRIPVPAAEELFKIGELVDVSERAYALTVRTAEERRRLVRRLVVERIREQTV